MRDKIANLLQKGMDPGCSEAEAAACLKKAQQLMLEHGLTEEECMNADSDAFVEDTWATKWSDKHGAIIHPIDRYLGSTLGKFFGVKVTYSVSKTERINMNSFGLESDVQHYTAMRAKLVEQFDRDWLDYKKRDRKDKRRVALPEIRKGFSVGYCNTIRKRLEEVMNYTAEDGSPGNALIWRKQDMIQAEFEKRGWKRGSGVYGGNKDTNFDAMVAGKVKGGAAKFYDDIYHGRQQYLIGVK